MVNAPVSHGENIVGFFVTPDFGVSTVVYVPHSTVLRTLLFQALNDDVMYVIQCVALNPL